MPKHKSSRRKRRKSKKSVRGILLGGFVLFLIFIGLVAYGIFDALSHKSPTLSAEEASDVFPTETLGLPSEKHVTMVAEQWLTMNANYPRGVVFDEERVAHHNPQTNEIIIVGYLNDSDKRNSASPRSRYLFAIGLLLISSAPADYAVEDTDILVRETVTTVRVVIGDRTPIEGRWPSGEAEWTRVVDELKAQLPETP